MQVQRRQAVSVQKKPEDAADVKLMKPSDAEKETTGSQKETYHSSPGEQPKHTEEVLLRGSTDSKVEMNAESAKCNDAIGSSVDVDDQNVNQTDAGDVIESNDHENEGLPAEGRDVKMAEANLFERLEDTLETQRETQEQLERLNQLIKILDNAPSQMNEDEQISMQSGERKTLLVQHVGEEGNPSLVGDTVAAAALLSAHIPTNEEYQEPTQPTDTTSTNVDSITIVGDILGLAQSGGEGEDPPSAGVVDHTAAESGSKESASVKETVTPSKKVKRQIAASFMHS